MGLALLLFAVAVAYVPGLPSASVAPRWAVMTLGAAVLLMAIPKIRMTPAHCLGAVFVVYCCASYFWSAVPLSTLGGIAQLIVLAAAFVIGAHYADEDWDRAWDALALGVTVSAPIAVAQSFGWTGIETASQPPIAGLFLSKAFLAQAGMVALIPALYSRRWWLVPGPLLCAVLPMARESLVVIAVLVGAVLIGRVGWRRALLGFMPALLAVTVLLVIDLGHGDRLESLDNRLVMWQFAAANFTPLGWGLNTFGDLLPTFEYAHNEAVHFAFELGIGSILLWAIFAYAIGARLERERLVLIAILVQSCFTFPLHMPLTALVAALVAGRLSTRRHADGIVQSDGRGDDSFDAENFGDAGGYPLPPTRRRREPLSV